MTTKKKQAGSTASAVGKPRHLCEGWLDEGCEGNPVFYPDRIVVLQGEKAWLALGEDNQLDESFGAVTLVENYDDLELEERVVNGNTVKLPKGGRWVVEGPAQRSDVKNANQRTYSRKIWETLIEDKDSYVQTAIRERAMTGHVEHPKDGRTDLKETAILTTKAKLLEDGTVWGQFEILETPNGLILQELTRKGVKWGVSSRGTGTVGDDGAVSEEDYKLKTWDAVASPSTPGAHPTLVTGTGKTSEADNTNTEDGTQGPLSEDLQGTLDTIVTLSETEPDDLAGRIKLRRQLLDALSSLDENALQRILQQDQGWAKIAAAVERARQSEEDGASVDAAIDEALASGEGGDDVAGFMEIVESLQEQVSDSVQESRRLTERLEAAESEVRVQAERLVEQEGELVRLRTECDLARDLLSETPGRNAGEVTAAADEAIDEVPELEEHRALLESVGTPAQVRTLAEALAPSPVEETTETEEKPKRSMRAALPVGLALDETDHKPSKPTVQISENSGARVVAAMPGFKKQP